MKQLWMRLIILHHIVFFSLSPQFLILLLLLCVSFLFKRHSLGRVKHQTVFSWDFCERCLDCFLNAIAFLFFDTRVHHSHKRPLFELLHDCNKRSAFMPVASTIELNPSLRPFFPPKSTFAAFHVSDLSNLNGNQWYWTLKIIKNTICVLAASFVSVT